MEPFRYRPLDAARREYRVVVIEPGGRADPIVCSLWRESRLASNQHYCALSYTWGPPLPLVPIELDGVRFLVRKNLWIALVELRNARCDEGLVFKIWIDAICINQADTRERNEQVAMMAGIYADAAEVIVWLGPSFVDSDIALGFLSDCRDAQQYGPHFKSSYRFGAIYQSENWHALRKVLSLDYWSRVWIVQEVILGNKIMLFCGSKGAGWSTLEAAFWVLDIFSESSTHVNDWPAVTRDRLLRSYAARLVARRKQLGKGMDVISLLETCEDSQCTDLRDKVFGILGLATRHQGASDGFHLLKADYAKSTWDLFEDMLNLRRYEDNEKWISASHVERYLQACLPTNDRDRQTEICLQRRRKEEVVSEFNRFTIHFSQFLQRTLGQPEPPTMDNGSNDAPLGIFNNNDGITATDGPRIPYSISTSFSLRPHTSAARYSVEGILVGKLGLQDWHFSSNREEEHFMGMEVPRTSTEATKESCGTRANVFQQIWEEVNGIQPTKSENRVIHHSCCGRDVICGHGPSETNGPRSWATEDSRVVYTNADTQVGDYLCRFAYSDVAAILRHVGDHVERMYMDGQLFFRTRKEYHLVSRALLLKKSGEKEVPLHKHSSKSFDFSVPDLEDGEIQSQKIECFFEAATLRYLTC
jgi:hypothetical protein